METSTFGTNSIDTHSLPVSLTKLKFGTLFQMKPRESLEKPGRSLSVVWDERRPLISSFKNGYTYFVTFTQIGNLAGNHYHEKKEEIYFPVVGKFTVILEHPTTKESEKIVLDAQEHRALFVPKGIAHVVKSESDPAVLLVTATESTVDSDHFDYAIHI